MPLALDLNERRVLVVGGGPVAARKARAFLEHGAKVKAVALAFAPHFPECSALERFQRAFEPDDLRDCLLAVAATDDRDVNARVRAEARTRGVWVNDASDPAASDFHTQSLIERGPITIGVSTGALSPMLSRAVAARIEAALGPEWTALCELAATFEIATPQRGAFWRAILESPALELLRANDQEGARQLLETLAHFHR